MLLRFRSKNGTSRIECKGTDTLKNLLETWIRSSDIDIERNSILVARIDNPNEYLSVTDIAQTVDNLKLKHGDILMLKFNEVSESGTSVKTSENTKCISGSMTTSVVPGSIEELPVDIELEKLDGLIQRKRSQLCRHGDMGMCEYCSPLPPWDRTYMKENNIKHIPFHAYVKEINEQINKKSGSGSYIPPLSQPNFKVPKNCPSSHAPWPRGICSKCQPSAISLQLQEFRMVDHVEFQTGDLINEFIESWRNTGFQRFGYLYGTYKKYANISLGIKAVVEAIWEPPQNDEQDGLSYDVDIVERELQQLDLITKQMGLIRVGMIFTDLTDTGNGDGTVFCKRHKDSFFMSSIEVILASRNQLKHPNVSKFSRDGFFSSKFVTCVVSGNLKGEIDLSAYQVSAAAEALVDADIITASTHPSMAYIKQSDSDRYVPEIFHMRKNEYNITIKENSRSTFPVDYFLVSLTHGFPLDSNNPIRAFLTTSGFPWANRQYMGYSQDYYELKRYLLPAATGCDLNILQKKLSNFHLLLYINSLQILNIDEWNLLLKATINASENGHHELLQLTSSPGWHTLLIILKETI